MTQIELSRKTDIRKSTISDLYHKFEHIDKICEILDCSSGELFKYVSNKIKTTGKDLIIEEHGNCKKHS